MEGLTEAVENLRALLENILGVPLYRIAFALLLFLLSLAIRKLLITVVVRALRRLVARTETTLDDVILEVVAKPLSFLVVVGGLSLALLILGLENQIVFKVLRSFVILAVSWTAYNLVLALEPNIYAFSERFGKEFAKEIGGFFIKLGKAFVIVVGTVAFLQEWGINVSALIASLGLGGLAFALAAKDTVSNLFGGLTILADKSMKVGDWVKVGDVEGIVEDIGLRTTKIRTFEKSLVVVPNQIIATQPLENFSRRGVRRIKMIIGITYDTPREKVEKIVEEIREMLKSHPRIAKDQLCMVYFRDFGESSLDIFVYCFTDTADWEEYLAIRQDVNLKIMEIVERNGSSFAFPSRSIYIEKMP